MEVSCAVRLIYVYVSLGAKELTKELRKATVSFVLSVRMELGSNMSDFFFFVIFCNGDFYRHLPTESVRCNWKNHTTSVHLSYTICRQRAFYDTISVDGGRMAASITREQQRKVAIGCKLCLTCGETVRGTLRVRQDVGSYTVALAFNCSRAVPIETITAN